MFIRVLQGGARGLLPFALPITMESPTAPAARIRNDAVVAAVGRVGAAGDDLERAFVAL